jgi:hypothetical protein
VKSNCQSSGRIYAFSSLFIFCLNKGEVNGLAVSLTVVVNLYVPCTAYDMISPQMLLASEFRNRRPNVTSDLDME